MSYRWWSSARTSRGRRRLINEDAVLERPDRGLWLVADGMGGHSRGDVASRIVVDALADAPGAPTLDAFRAEVKLRLARANERIRADAETINATMGTTVVALLVHGREFLCLWAGDSRAYLMRRGRLMQLSKDHSRLQELIDGGLVRAEEARHHPAAHRITRAVGAVPELYVDELRGSLADDDVVLLCSDGLTREVDDTELATTLTDFPCGEASRELLEISLERGAHDNVSVVVISFEETTGASARANEDTAINYALRRRRTLSAGGVAHL